MNLQQKVELKRRLNRLNNLLNKVRLKVFDHEDAGKKDKHDRIVKLITKRKNKIKKLLG